MTKIVYAQDTLVAGIDDMALVLHAGDVWAADDPLVLSRPELFGPEPPEQTIRRTSPAPVVEQATQAPGERRNVRRA